MRKDYRHKCKHYVCGKCGAGNGTKGSTFKTPQQRNAHKRDAHGK